MKNEFFYEFNCIEDGEWIPERVTFEVGSEKIWRT